MPGQTHQLQQTKKWQTAGNAVSIWDTVSVEPFFARTVISMRCNINTYKTIFHFSLEAGVNRSKNLDPATAEMMAELSSLERKLAEQVLIEAKTQIQQLQK